MEPGTRRGAAQRAAEKIEAHNQQQAKYEHMHTSGKRSRQEPDSDYDDPDYGDDDDDGYGNRESSSGESECEDDSEAMVLSTKGNDRRPAINPRKKPKHGARKCPEPLRQEPALQTQHDLQRFLNPELGPQGMIDFLTTNGSHLNARYFVGTRKYTDPLYALIARQSGGTAACGGPRLIIYPGGEVDVMTVVAGFRAAAAKGATVVFLELGLGSGERWHANLLVLLVSEKLLVRYEPHGSELKTEENNDVYCSVAVDKILTPIAKELEVTYVPQPGPKKGIQASECSYFLRRYTDPHGREVHMRAGGFCAAACLAVALLCALGKSLEETLAKIPTDPLKARELVLAIAALAYELTYDLERKEKIQRAQQEALLALVREGGDPEEIKKNFFALAPSSSFASDLLEAALRQNSGEVVSFLLAQGTEVHAHHLYQAARTCSVALQQLFLARESSRDDITELCQVAMMHGHVEGLKVLAEMLLGDVPAKLLRPSLKEPQFYEVIRVAGGKFPDGFVLPEHTHPDLFHKLVTPSSDPATYTDLARHVCETAQTNTIRLLMSRMPQESLTADMAIRAAGNWHCDYSELAREFFPRYNQAIEGEPVFTFLRSCKSRLRYLMQHPDLVKPFLAHPKIIKWIWTAHRHEAYVDFLISHGLVLGEVLLATVADLRHFDQERFDFWIRKGATFNGVLDKLMVLFGKYCTAKRLSQRRASMLQRLLDHGGNPFLTMKNPQGKTVYMLAAKHAAIQDHIRIAGGDCMFYKLVRTKPQKKALSAPVE